MAWLLLVLAGFEEITSVIAMKYVDGLKRKIPILVMVIGFGFSFYCLARAMQELPAGVAYAVWAGVGTVGISLVGFLWFKERMNIIQIGFISLILIGVIGLRLST